MEQRKVIIIGKNYSTSLGVIRALGVCNYEIIVLKLIEKGQRYRITPELSSKYVSKYELVIQNEQMIIDNLMKFIDKQQKYLIIPTDDFVASVIDRHYQRLKDYFIMPSIAHTGGCIFNNMDKSVQKEKAMAAGLHVALGCSIPVDNQNTYTIPKSIVYPCITKPQCSVGSPKTYIQKCENVGELNSLLKKVAEKGKNVILVETLLPVCNEYVVPGVACGERVVIPCMIRKTKTGSGAHKGVTARGVLMDFGQQPELRKKLKKFVKDLNFFGLFDIEILESQGEFYFNEINLRYGAAGYALTAGGVNLPQIYAEYMLFGTVLPHSDVSYGKTFVSEKVEIEDYKAGYCTWKNYCTETQQAEISFIRSKEDPKPYRSFKKIEFRARVLHFIKLFRQRK